MSILNNSFSAQLDLLSISEGNSHQRAILFTREELRLTLSPVTEELLHAREERGFGERFPSRVKGGFGESKKNEIWNL
ncbi:hypothetical protein ZOSMA_555G00020 [Zostera marina]|uniref:Uncharacterized protein n=1 Tax=Zostera marina TaxID=29655 RepID=A0A0K9NWA9_ZOSMR|nr:hypothetical protein ZOSMA_555G00020 [Zostera marina]